MSILYRDTYEKIEVSIKTNPHGVANKIVHFKRVISSDQDKIENSIFEYSIIRA